VRVVGGKLKGLRLQVPKGFDSRPTTDFAKESLFNIIENEKSILGSDVLDLFTGTGSLSIEFASRGANQVYAVDINTACLSFIHKVCEIHQIKHIKVLKNDARKFLKIAKIPFDFIVADPPYNYKHYDDLIQSVLENNLLKPDGLLIVEHGKQNDFTHHKKFHFLRNYGGVHFSFFKNNDRPDNKV